ncbi:zeta toxin family protein [Streptomyces kronopolitis]
MFAEARRSLTAPSKTQPRVLIFGGPQGSRKSTLLPVVAAQLGYRDAVKLDGDDLYALHPRFDGLVQERGAIEAMNLLRADVAPVRDMVLDHVRAARQDIVLVGPFTGQEFTFGEIEQFRGAGYQVEMAYTSLHPALSQLGVMDRQGVMPSIELQAMVFAGVPAILEEAERLGVVEAVHLANAGGEIAFTRTRQEADQAGPGDTAIRDTLHQLRYQPWTPEVREDFQRRRAAVETRDGPQWPERLASVDRHAAPMLQPDATSATEAARLAALSFPGPATTAPGATPRTAEQGTSAETERSPDSGPEL